MFAQFFWGLLLTIGGAVITIYGNKLYEMFGSIPFAERYLGTQGGSRLMYKLIGIIIAFTGILVATNLWNSFLLLLISPFIPSR